MTTAPTCVNLWHGYGLTDIDRLARITAACAPGGRILDPTDRYNTAWSAIAETLCAATEPPTRRDLFAAGANAVNRAGQDHRRTWGMTRTWGSAEGDVAAYARYWELDRRSTGSPEDTVVDRTALQQIWPRLSVTHRQVLYALAVHDGDHQAAADSLAKSLVTYRSHLRAARAAYRAWWHQHETPSRMWGKSGQRGRRTAAQALANRRQQRARRAAAAP
jgi:hypothetical protein